MLNTKITIDRLVIRSRGMPASVVQSAVTELGPALLNALAQQPELAQPGRLLQLNDLNLGTLTVARTANSSQFRGMIAQTITTAIVRNSTDTEGT